MNDVVSARVRIVRSGSVVELDSAGFQQHHGVRDGADELEGTFDAVVGEGHSVQHVGADGQLGSELDTVAADGASVLEGDSGLDAHIDSSTSGEAGTSHAITVEASERRGGDSGRSGGVR